MNGRLSMGREQLQITRSFYQSSFIGNHLRPHQSLEYRTPAEALDIAPYGCVDKANTLTHIPTNNNNRSERLSYFMTLLV